MCKPQIALLAVSPIQQEPESEASDDDSTTSDVPGKETVQFNADAHAAFIKNTFKHCNQVDFDRWCVAQICDNASVDRRITTKLCIKHIGCKMNDTVTSVKSKTTDAALFTMSQT